MTIKEYLSGLGDTPDKVAESLRRQGIKGVRLSMRSCPVINGIYEACPDYWAGLRIVNVSKRPTGDYTCCATLNDSQIIDPVLPPSVMNFIGEFDDGKYPELECSKVVKETSRKYI